MRDKYLSSAQVAKMFDLTINALYTFRKRCEGPPFFRIGDRIYYSLKELQYWVKNESRNSTKSTNKSKRRKPRR